MQYHLIELNLVDKRIEIEDKQNASSLSRTKYQKYTKNKTKQSCAPKIFSL